MRYNWIIAAAACTLARAQSESSLTTSAFALLGNDITGASASMKAFDLTLLANTTHVLAVFNITEKLSKVGWAAFGVGTKMSNSDMIITWPYLTKGNTTWTLSHRTASGHLQPQGFPTGQSPTDFSIHYPLTSTDSTLPYTTVAVVRTLSPDYPSDATNVKITRAKSQSIIWAYSGANPDSSDYASNLVQHLKDDFGRTTFDLSVAITPPASAGEGSTNTNTTSSSIPQAADSSAQEWTHHDWLVAMHATAGALAWLIISPTAVLLGRTARKHAFWIKLHQIFQSALTTSLTLVCFILGVAAVNDSQTAHFGGPHKQLGLVLLLLLFAQVGLGFFVHHKYDPNRTKRPLQNIGHIVLGITLTILGIVQIFKGSSLYASSFQRTTPGGIYALYYIITIGVALTILVTVGMIIQQRKASGLGWKDAAFGFGRNSPNDVYGMRTVRGLPIKTYTHAPNHSTSTINSKLSEKW